MTRVLKVDAVSKTQYRVNKHYPKILLQGKYLQQAGIEIGEHVEVIIEENQITIKRLSK